MLYRKKPVVVEAWQWDGEFLEDCENVPQWLLTAEENGDVYVKIDWYIIEGSYIETSSMEIDTLEGTHIARPGDYIIRDIQGELYPCKPDIFAKTYEAEYLPDTREKILNRLTELKEEYSPVEENGMHNFKWCAICEAIDIVEDVFEKERRTK